MPATQMPRNISVEYELLVTGEGPGRICAVEFSLHNLSDHHADFPVTILTILPARDENEHRLLSSAHALLLERVRRLLRELEKGPPPPTTGKPP